MKSAPLNRWAGFGMSKFAGFIIVAVLLAGNLALGQVPSFVGTKAGQVRDDNGLKMKMVWCPAGQFVMGSPKDEKGRFDGDYETQVSVKLTKGFWLGKFEVTQGQWRRVLETTPWKGQRYVIREGDNFPVVYVSWKDAMQFCEELTEHERTFGRLPQGWCYTLPTEAQWEYACRAGTTTRFSFGDNEAEIGDYAWYGRTDNGNAQNESSPHPVGLKKPNQWGFCDMHGNVEELCRDAFVQKRPGGNDPCVTIGPVESVNFRGGGMLRAIRGGSWWDPPSSCRSASRDCTTPGYKASFEGFRVALEQVGK